MNPSNGWLLVAPHGVQALSSGHLNCASQNYYGSYIDADKVYTVFKVEDEGCAQAISEFNQDFKYFAPAPSSDSQLVWLRKSAIDPSLKSDSEDPLIYLQDLWGPTSRGGQDTQVVLEGHQRVSNRAFEVHYASDNAVLLSMDSSRAAHIDTSLPAFWKSTLLPTSPSSYIPVPPSAIEPVKHILENLRFNPQVASVVNNISLAQIKNDVRFLTGEDGESGIVSRHSFSKGAVTAAHWLKERVEATGASCRLMPFLTGFAPNVICRYAAIRDTNTTVLISGHYDSRGSFGSVRAPGGDDDGSGTTGVLSVARTIARKGVKFHSNVELAFFAGEEQGLLGSRAYAKELRSTDANLLLMIQADMTAYRAPGEPLQLGLPDIIGTSEVTQLVANISNIYTPELKVGFTPACCSDHQSFHEQGFPASQVFERAGPIADPMYHNSGDLSDRENYDFEQLRSIAKVQFATLLHAAGFEL
ncbi:hypothetical protein CVT24_009852 [Panaeolus cyanescens]|uniref:Peptide hydrolase n=1 Tax=Panaeolus cyanescens TaxID=181874 RepID=A0A409VXY8_9AGAR|nr:hypothetical protein CVT24_009852 [Panaeolus cyanescens]